MFKSIINAILGFHDLMLDDEHTKFLKSEDSVTLTGTDMYHGSSRKNNIQILSFMQIYTNSTRFPKMIVLVIDDANNAIRYVATHDI